MKWTEAGKGDHIIKAGAAGEPMALLQTGTENGTNWAFTGDFSHLLRLRGLKWLSASDRDSGHFVDKDGKIQYWVETLENTPEIADKDDFKMQIARVQVEMETADFKDWLDYEIEITE